MLYVLLWLAIGVVMVPLLCWAGVWLLCYWLLYGDYGD